MNVDPKALRPQVWNPEKLERLLERLPLGGEIDAPEITLGKTSIEYVDGIHRTAAAIILGLQSIKILATKRNAGQIATIVRQRERELETDSSAAPKKLPP